MRISYNWLKQYIDLKISPEELEDKLTFAGIEVEGVEKTGVLLRQIIIAQVTSCEKMPDSDHLSLCQVFDGKESMNVVCGAPNVRKGLVVAFAPIGTELGEFKIKKTKIRGFESSGMICSEKELELSDNHDGIIELPSDAPVGMNLAAYLKLDDTVFEVEITPNRPDLLGMIGVARDLSALFNLPLHLNEPVMPKAVENITDYLKLSVLEPEKCTRYIARVIKNVVIKESPDWLKRHLLAMGLRPINNVVDITNLVMMEWGHPLHAFDYDKLEGKEIIVRDAIEGEEIEALNGETYKLVNSDLVIADGKTPGALAGVIGSVGKSISEATTTIVLEAACFQYATIRKTSYNHKIFTDSSYRFERGLSPETCEIISRRACELICELAEGVLIEGSLDVCSIKLEKLEVTLRTARVKKLLTIDLDNSTIIGFMQNLGLEFVKEVNQSLHFLVPYYRNDLLREIDLIEEIIRLHGYNNVEEKNKPQQIMNHEIFSSRRKIQDILVNNGFYDTVTLSFANPSDFEKLLLPENSYLRKAVRLINPQGIDSSIMRTNLIIDQIKVAVYNLNRGNYDIKTFEINKVYHNIDGSYSENYQLTGLMTGRLIDKYWKEKEQSFDFYDVKGVTEELLDIHKVEDFSFVPCDESYLIPNLSLSVEIKGKKIGSFGKLNPSVVEAFGIDIMEFKQDLFIFDLNITELLKISVKKSTVYVEPARYPLIRRDLSFVVSQEHKIEVLTKLMYSVNPSIIKEIKLIDEYRGKGIENGMRSLTFSIIYGSEKKTLTDNFIDNLFQKIVQLLEQQCNIKMR
ncbi:MAG: phenylalanine--tRNA ligase subunit beta [Candidatus Cloacimonetes bacterium]|nr:phenylalanine--tRNA ligase subunit beta [Candidatus Cloacimonadota bacterium]